MTDEHAPDSSRLELAAALLASSVIAVTVVITTAVRTFLSVINPRGIDASRLGAYELETVGTLALAALGTIVAVVLILAPQGASRVPRGAARPLHDPGRADRFRGGDGRVPGVHARALEHPQSLVERRQL